MLKAHLCQAFQLRVQWIFGGQIVFAGRTKRARKEYEQREAQKDPESSETEDDQDIERELTLNDWDEWFATDS